MILPDVNVLVYAFHPDSPHHTPHRRWLDEVVNGNAPYGMSPQVLASVIRIGTHPGIFTRPGSIADATTFASALLTQPHCHIVQPGMRHWGIFQDLCRRTKAAGNLVQDAWFAALAIESGCVWITADRDYARFEGLRWQTPAAER